MNARPAVMWMLVAEAPRHEWFMYWTASTTRKGAVAAFVAQFVNEAVGEETYRRRKKEKAIRFARVALTEVKP